MCWATIFQWALGFSQAVYQDSEDFSTMDGAITTEANQNFSTLDSALARGFQYLGQHLPEESWRFQHHAQHRHQRSHLRFQNHGQHRPHRNHQGFQHYGQCNNDWSKSEHQYIGQRSCPKKANDFRTIQSTVVTEDAWDLKTTDSTVTTEKHQQFQLNGQCNYHWFQLHEEMYAFRIRDCTG